MPITTPPRKIEWKLDALTAMDVVLITHWKYETDVVDALTAMMVIAQGFTDTRLDFTEFAIVLPQFIEAVTAHVLAQATDDYLTGREGDNEVDTS